MASLFKDSKDRQIIQFKGVDGKRRSIRLGKVSNRHAEKVLTHVRELAAAARTGSSPKDATADWLRTIALDLSDKLADVGLITAREVATLDAFIGSYIANRRMKDGTKIKDSTRTNLGHTRRCLVKFFGADRRLRDITEADADDWRAWLIDKEKLSPATVDKRCSNAKQFFQGAVRRKLLVENPFAVLQSGCQVNRAKDHYISRENTDKILAACPDAEWRLVFALSRYAGLRCPSEHLALRWGDIDWERQRITVHASKTEHHSGKGQRIIPLFPELRPYLDAVWEAAKPGAEWVISRYRDTNANLRTQLLRIIAKAGLKAWPKPFQNLRASCETDLVKRRPAHVAAAWLGHTPRIAQQHYLQVTEADFAEAVNPQWASGAKSGATDAKTPVQNQVQQPAAIAGSNRENVQNDRQTKELLPATADGYRSLPMLGMGVAGFEPATPTV